MQNLYLRRWSQSCLLRDTEVLAWIRIFIRSQKTQNFIYTANSLKITKGLFYSLLEVNGKLVLVKSKEDMVRLLAVSPDPAQLVVMRRRPPHLEQLMSSLRAELMTVREQAGEAERTRDSFRSDNLRLTHRISYLEEQVSSRPLSIINPRVVLAQFPQTFRLCLSSTFNLI